jgi:hypothetical protein
MFRHKVEMDLSLPPWLTANAQHTSTQAFDESEGIEVAWNQVKVCVISRGESGMRAKKGLLTLSLVDSSQVNDLVSSPAERERLFAEIRVLKQLKHKNIVSGPAVHMLVRAVLSCPVLSPPWRCPQPLFPSLF